MHQIRISLQMMLGGAICGCFGGILLGALGGAVYGAFVGNLSPGLDGALGGGGIGILVGAVVGAALKPPDEVASGQISAVEESAIDSSEERSWGAVRPARQRQAPFRGEGPARF